MKTNERPVLLYDGECRLCHGTVRAILRLERSQDLLFSPQQSAAGQTLLREHGLSSEPETVILLRGRHCSFESEAALGSMEHMGGHWPLLARMLRLVPRVVRDLVYRGVSRIRHQIFGTVSDHRDLPRPDLRERFLL